MGFNPLVLIEFLVFNLIWIQLPGLLVFDLLGGKKQHWATKCLGGYVIGVMLLVVEYFIECNCFLYGIITFFNPLLAAFIIITWLINGRHLELPEEGRIRIEQIVVFIELLIFAFIAFQAKWVNALTYERIQINHDLLYHVGNIVALSDTFPAMDPRVTGVSFYYHYFYDLLFAMCKHMFGMDAYTLLITGMPLIVAWPLGLAMIILGERVYVPKYEWEKGKGFNTRYFFCCTGMLLSCVVIYPINVIASFVPLSWPNDHFFTNYNTMGLAVAVFILVIDYIVTIWQEKADWKNLLVLALYTAMLTGVKGPCGMMLLAITFAVLVSEGYIEKNWSFSKLYYFLTELASFLLIYVVVVAGFGGTGDNNRAIRLTAEGTLTNSRVAQVFYKYLDIDPYAFPLVLLVAVLIAICLMGPGFMSFLGFLGIKIRELVKTNHVGELYDWVSIGTIVIGVCGCLMLTIEGFSQGYMVITAVPCFFYCYVRYLQLGKSRFIKFIQYLTFALGFGLLVGDLAYYLYDDIFVEAGYTYESDEPMAYVSPLEMEGYIWLRDNSEKDDLVVSDRQSENLDYRSTFFYVTAFAERPVFLEGHSYSSISEEDYNVLRGINGSFYSADEERARMAFEEYGIDYLLVHRSVHPDYVKGTNRLILCYENEDISIYKYE